MYACTYMCVYVCMHVCVYDINSSNWIHVKVMCYNDGWAAGVTGPIYVQHTPIQHPITARWGRIRGREGTPTPTLSSSCGAGWAVAGKREILPAIFVYREGCRMMWKGMVLRERERERKKEKKEREREKNLISFFVSLILILLTMHNSLSSPR